MKAVRSWVASQKSTKEQVDVPQKELSGQQKQSDNKQRHDSGYHESQGEHDLIG